MYLNSKSPFYIKPRRVGSLPERPEGSSCDVWWEVGSFGRAGVCVCVYVSPWATWPYKVRGERVRIRCWGQDEEAVREGRGSSHLWLLGPHTWPPGSAGGVEMGGSSYPGAAAAISMVPPPPPPLYLSFDSLLLM